MIKLLWRFLLLVLLAAGFAWLADRPGTLTIRWLGREIQMSFIAGVVMAVLATGAAGFVFTWLRRRSGSLIAPIALHWSLNGLGALAAALVWHLSMT